MTPNKLQEFVCSNWYMKEHTKRRRNSDNQKGLIQDLKENRIQLHVLQLISIVLNRFIRETYLYSSIHYYILNILRYLKCQVTLLMNYQSHDHHRRLWRCYRGKHICDSRGCAHLKMFGIITHSEFFCRSIVHILSDQLVSMF